MDNLTTESIMTSTTMALEVVPFNFTGMWISMGVLGAFILAVMIYGFLTTLSGTVYLPARQTEDKEPLHPSASADHRDDIEVDIEKRKPTDSANGTTAAAAADWGKEKDDVAQPTMDRASSNPTVPQKHDVAAGPTTSIDDEIADGDSMDGGQEVKLEVYEQNVDTEDEYNTRL